MSLKGILVPDPRINADTLDAIYTTADEQGIEAGPAVATSTTAMVLRTSGDIADGDSIQVDTQRGGYAGPDYRAGGFSYSYDAGTTDYYWDVPNAPHGWEYLNFRHISATSDAYNQYEPHLCALSSGGVVLAVKEEQGAAIVIRVRKFDPSTSTWSSGVTLSDDSVISDIDTQPCIVELPSGRLHLYHLVDVGSNERQVAYWVSDDVGVTWTLAAPAVLDEAMPYNTSASELMRVAVSETGELGMLLYIDSSLWWAAATAPGARFQLVTVNDGVFDDPIGIDLLPEPGGGFRLFAHASGDSDQIRTIVIGSAFEIDDDANAWSTITTLDQIGVLPSFCVWRDESGTLFLNVVGLGTTTPRHAVYRSENGSEWESATGGAGQGYWLASASEAYTGSPSYVSHMSAVTSRGLTITAGHIHTTNLGPDDGSILAVYSGGYTTHTMPPSQVANLDYGRQAWLQSYWGVDDPANWGEWSVSGGGSDAPVRAGYEVSSALDATRVFTSTDASLDVEDQEIIVELRGSSVDSNISSDPRSGMRISYYNGSDEYILGVNLVSNGFATQDAQSGSYSSTYALDMDDEWEIRVAMYRNRFAVWYRAGAEDGGRVERAWTLATSGTGLTSKSGAGSGITITWGNLDTGASTNTWVCRGLDYALQAAGYLTDTGTKDLPKNPRSFSRSPLPLGQGLRLSAISGPTQVGDQWTVAPAYRFGFANLDDPSPAVEWRSSTDASSVDFVWDLTGFADDAPFLSEALGVAMLGINFGQFSVIGIPDGGIGTAEDTLMTVYVRPYASLAGTLAFDYQREGSILSCQSSTTKAETPWIGHGELVGGYVIDVSSGVICPILANTSGRWTDDSTVKPLRLHLGGDPSALSGTGVCQIVVPNVVAYHLAANIASDYRYLKVSIPAQDTPDGYFRIGRMMLGPLHLFGVPPSWARSRDVENNVDLRTRRDGSRSAHRNGAPRRAETVKWSEGIDESELFAATQRTETYSGRVLAVPGDTALLMEGLFRELNGSLEPCVYFGAVDVSAGVETITSPRGFLYGRIVSQWSSDVIVGEEEESQLVRGGEVRIEEEL